MGYSARYHATSLIAVFLALAIGILIGAEFGGDALTNTRKDLEHSLTGNLQDARARADELSAELGRADEFAGRVYPVLVRDRLAGKRIGDRRARRPAGRRHLGGDRGRAGADRGAPGRRRGGARAGRPARRSPATSRRPASPTSRRNPDTLTAFGAGVGRQLVRGGTLLERVRGHLFSRASGNFGALDGVIVVRDQPEDMGPVQRADRRPARVGADGRDRRDADAGGRGRDLRPPNRPRSPSSRATTSPASTTSTWPRAGWRWSSRCSAPRAASASRAAPTACCPTCCAAGSLSRRRDLGRLPGSRSRWRCWSSRRGCAGCSTPAWCGRTTAAPRLAFPLGAVLATAALVALAPLAFLNDRADLDLLDPELRRWIALPARHRLPRLPRRLARAGRGGRGAARLARARAGAARRAALDRRDQGDRGAGARRLRRLRAAGSNPGATWPTSRC